MYIFLANIASKKSGGGGGSRAITSGKHTLRFKANEPARIEEVSPVKQLAEEKINTLLENFLGINDADLGEEEQRNLLLILKLLFLLLLCCCCCYCCYFCI